MKTIFWNVDTQYDFMRPDGALYVKGAETIEDKLAELTVLARKEGIKVVNTADWHTPQSLELSNRPDFVKTFPPHCLMYTPGARFVPATEPGNSYKVDWRKETFNADKVRDFRNIVLYKDKFGVFEGTPHADNVLEIIAPERAIVYGVATNVCVDFAVRGLLERKIEVYVPTDAIKELPNLPSPLNEWEKLGVKLIKASEVAKYI